MTENAKKIFEILGVEPNEEFEVVLNDNNKFPYKLKFDENLQGYCFRNEWRFDECLLRFLLSGTYQIIKLPKESKKIKKKLRDITEEEWNKWKDKNCSSGNCNKCFFDKVNCFGTYSNRSWFYNKDLFSNRFLDQEIEVVEE